MAENRNYRASSETSSSCTWTAKDFIERYSMEEHIEGGWFSEIYRNPENYQILPERYGKNAIRSFGTHIYYLLENEDFSNFRRLESDELWHFYTGIDMLVYVIDETSGQLSTHQIGPQEGSFFLCVKRGDYCASRLLTTGEGKFSLLGLTVIPGYEYDDFKMSKEEDLVKLYPQHSEIIKKYTKQ